MDSTFILNILSLLYPVKSDGDTAVVLPMTMKVYKNIITAECGGDFAVSGCLSVLFTCYLNVKTQIDT